MIHTAIHDATAAMVIPSDVLHEREFAVAPPPNVSRSTPIIGPSSHMGGSDQFMRVHTSCASGPNNAISTITIMLMDRSNGERLPRDLAKIPAMITPQEKSERSIIPKRCGDQLVANRKGHITIWNSTAMVTKSINTCRIGARVGRSLKRSIGQATHIPMASAAIKSRMPGR